VRFRFDGELIYWRGPSPYHFITIPLAEAGAIRSVARLVTYGWGVIPVRATIGRSTFDTSLFPRHGGYVLPVRDRVRLAEGLALGDEVEVELEIRSDRLA